MSKYKIIKLTNLSSIHIGTGKENYDFSSSVLHSDTVSAAIASIRARNGRSKDIHDFLSSFTVSSAFPFYKDTLYMPVPKGKLNVVVKGKQEFQYRKLLKKIRYAELSIWQKIITGHQVEIDESQINDEYLNGVSNAVEGDITNKIPLERVFVPRDGISDAKPFFFEWTFFTKDAGLFIIVDASDELFKDIKTLMRDLGESGIGTDKNVGGGNFSIESGEIDLPTIADANAQMLLSLYAPVEEELDTLHLQDSVYGLQLRGGFLAGSNNPALCHLRKKSIYMFEEGSVFKSTNNLKGKVVDLTPRWNGTYMHKVFRSGLSFSIPIKYRCL